jgi:hypothetical protein
MQKLLGEALRLELDLNSQSLKGHAQLDIQQRVDQRQIYLHFRQGEVLACSVNGKPARSCPRLSLSICKKNQRGNAVHALSFAFVCP